MVKAKPAKPTNQKKSKGKRAPKRCNYCRNHTSEIVLERGHGTCDYNNLDHFENCKKCERNYNKTKIARKFRDKKLSEKNIVKNGRCRRAGSPKRSTELNDMEINFNNEDITAIENIMTTNEDIFGFNNGLCDANFCDSNGIVFPANNIINESVDLLQALDHPMIFDDAVLTENIFDINDPSKIGYSMVVLPTNYPNDILYPDNAEEMKNYIEHASDELEKANKERLKIQYKTLEVGRWKVVCLDEYTRDLFIQEVSRWNIKKLNSESYLTLRVVAENKLPRHIKVSCLISQPMNEQDFLPSINGGLLNASRWSVDKIEPFGNKFKVFFGIDPKSYRYLYTDAYWLVVKNEYVKVNIDSNPFADEHSLSCCET